MTGRPTITTFSRALEHLVQEKQIASADLLAAKKAAWIDAYEHTPHGKPVELR